MESDQLNALLDDLSVLISSEILANDAKRASFEMISNWYSTKGYLNSTWIELLDLKKWIAIPDWGAEDGDVPVQGNDTEDEDNSYSEDDDDTEGNYPASMSTEDVEEKRDQTQDSLVIKASDTAHVLAVSAASGLGKMESQDMVNLLSRYARNGVVSNTSFLSFLNDLDGVENLSNNLRNKVFSDLFAIFNIFEQHSDTSSRGAEFRSLAVGLTVLCNGSKSAKLEVGFRVFEETRGEGRITQESLSAFLGSYLLTLVALQVVSNNKIAVNHAVALSDVISEKLDNRITFQNFGKWYNQEGFHYAPWIELLNLDKWEKITLHSKDNETGYEQSQSKYEGYDAQVSSDDDSDDNTDSREGSEEDGQSNDYRDDAFSILLNSHAFERKISVSKSCASRVFQTTREIMSRSCDMSTLVPELQAASKDGLISRKDFISILTACRFNVYAVLHGTESFLPMLFDAFDRANSGYCDLNELVTGIVMLDHQGTKSEKLVYAFDFIDKDSRGFISKRDIWKFFRSFLISVLLLSCPELRPSDYLHILVDESAVWVVESILSFVAKQADSEETPGYITFDDIADWYSSVGCSISAWIELLDFSKWIYLSS